MKTRYLAVGIVGTALLFIPTTTFAADSKTKTLREIQQALRQQGETTVSSPNADVTVSPKAENGVLFETDSGDILKLALPATGPSLQQRDFTLYNGTGHSQVAVQQTEDGVRALIHIDSPDASERYEFPMSGNVGSLIQQPNGSIVVFNELGGVISMVAPAWARDRNGAIVPTHYEIDGMTLVQVVNHRGGNYAYGITADPWVRDIAKALAGCAMGAVGFQELENIIRNRGGVKAAAKFVLRRAGFFAAIGCVTGVIAAL